MNELEKSVQLPPQWSTLAESVDWMYNFIFYTSVVFFVGIVGTMIYFLVKYRRRPGVKAEKTGHSDALEVAWTVLPIFLLAFLFHRGFEGYVESIVAPDNAIEVRVTAQQWSWTFEHEGGFVEMNEFHIPANRPLKVIMSSSDVLHSFFIPAFRVKRDVVPGMFTTAWFEATHVTPTQNCQTWEDCGDGLHCTASDGDEVGKCVLPLFCTEYCGAGESTNTTRNTNHSSMMANVIVLEGADYDKLMADGPPPPTECGEDRACWGKKLVAKSGCAACHSVDGSKMTGPTWKGLPGSKRAFADGSEREADLNYVMQSIRQPASQIVKGFEDAAMSPYKFSDKQIDAIYEYMKSLDGAEK